MASSPFSSSSSSSSSSLPLQNQELQITPEELFAFHNIDRQLFSRLVFNLRRKPSEAMHVAAFWLWFEHFNNKARYVDTILNLPDDLLETILEETLLCLRVAEVESGTGAKFLFRPHDSKPLSDIPMIENITGMERIDSLFFHENRILVLLGVSNIVQKVCLRAFQDLFQMLITNRAGPLYNYYFQNEPLSSIYSQNLGHGMLVYYPNQNPSIGIIPSQGHSPLTTSNPNCDLVTKPKSEAIKEDLLEMFDRIHINTHQDHHQQSQDQDEDRVVPTSERTIFLTFSKGYPISEIELREFLTRSFGEIVEDVHMQEVGEKEQPLYARLVVTDLIAMEAVLSGKGKVKFSINGKHVWARKYVCKINSNSPPSSPY